MVDRWVVGWECRSRRTQQQRPATCGHCVCVFSLFFASINQVDLDEFKTMMIKLLKS